MEDVKPGDTVTRTHHSTSTFTRNKRYVVEATYGSRIKLFDNTGVLRSTSKRYYKIVPRTERDRFPPLVSKITIPRKHVYALLDEMYLPDALSTLVAAGVCVSLVTIDDEGSFNVSLKRVDK